MTMREMERWQSGINVACIILLAANIYFAVRYVGLSWLFTAWVLGALILVLSVHYLRHKLVVQVPLLLCLFAWPVVMLSLRTDKWSILVVLAGMLLPIVIVFAAVWSSIRLGRRQPAHRN